MAGYNLNIQFPAIEWQVTNTNKMKNKLIVGYFMLALSMIAISCSGQASKQKTATQNTDSTKTVNNKTDKNMKTIIVDVRTVGEWNDDGHADCSVNIPLDKLQGRMDELKGYEKVIIVCRSGARAGSAKNMLEGAGIANVENLGPWQNINCQ